MQVPNDMWREILSLLDNQNIVNMRVNKRFALLAPTCVYTLNLDDYPLANGLFLPNVTTLTTGRGTSVEHFSNVTSLDISSTDIRNIAHMTKLKTLNIMQNEEIRDEDIISLTTITTLDVYGTNISDVGISPLTNLTKLDIGMCIITDLGLRKLTKLQSLLIYDSSISDISYLVELTELYVNSESKICDASIHKLTNLTLLSIENNSIISDAGISDLNLHTLIVCDNDNITGAGLCWMTSLTSLNARYSYIDFAPVSLTELDAYQSEIPAECLGGLTNLTKLTVNSRTRDNLWLSSLTNLKTLIISGDSYSEAALRNLTNIQRLDIYEATALDRWDFSHMPGLTALHVCAETVYTGVRSDLYVLHEREW